MDTAFLIDRILGHVHHTGSNRNHLIVHDQAVKLQLHPAFADEVARILVVLEAAFEITAVWKYRAAIQLHMAHLAKHRIADGFGFRRDFWLGNRALNQ